MFTRPTFFYLFMNQKLWPLPVPLLECYFVLCYYFFGGPTLPFYIRFFGVGPTLSF